MCRADDVYEAVLAIVVMGGVAAFVWGLWEAATGLQDVIRRRK